MRIYYHLSSYISHRLSGLAYIDCLRRLGHDVFCLPEEAPRADLAVIHDDPLNFPDIFNRLPCLRSLRSVACCVWENEILPEAYAAPLELVGEIWTPSHFSRHSMLPHCAAVHVLPHVVVRSPSSPADLAFARAALQGSEDAFRFFSIVDSVNPRKNLTGLLTAFAALRSRTARKTVLVLKQYRAAIDCSQLPGVISVTGDLSQGEMAALHKLCHAYVSAHHAEGWGLGLSEAMAHGKPVIATAWSGNMDYMNEHNSFPVPYTLIPVSALMCERIPLFRPHMRWAQIDRDALVRAMKQVAEGRFSRDLPEKAAGITKDFGPEAIARRLNTLLS